MRKIIPTLIFIFTLSACSSIDCPLNNTVYTVYDVLTAAGKADTLKDTLSISSRRYQNGDTLLLNLAVNTTKFELPVSYTQPEDILVFKITPKGSTTAYDTVTVQKDNIPHFESVDCSANYFHTIKGVTYTRHRIDSIVINNPNVTYDATKEHFHITFKSSN
jgi:hypothetical protein